MNKSSCELKWLEESGNKRGGGQLHCKIPTGFQTIEIRVYGFQPSFLFSGYGEWPSLAILGFN